VLDKGTNRPWNETSWERKVQSPRNITSCSVIFLHPQQPSKTPTCGTTHPNQNCTKPQCVMSTLFRVCCLFLIVLQTTIFILMLLVYNFTCSHKRSCAGVQPASHLTVICHFCPYSFGQLILAKIIEIVATRILRLKCTKFDSAQDPTGGGEMTKTAHGPKRHIVLIQNGPHLCPKRPTATSKTAHADVQNGPRLGQKRPTEFLLFVSAVTYL